MFTGKKRPVQDPTPAVVPEQSQISPTQTGMAANLETYQRDPRRYAPSGRHSDRERQSSLPLAGHPF
ncbi:MAG: hypothetical protein ACFFC7_02665 [Candidatus Hermodarchaeota archaeon]